MQEIQLVVVVDVDVTSEVLHVLTFYSALAAVVSADNGCGERSRSVSDFLSWVFTLLFDLFLCGNKSEIEEK